VKTFKTAYCTQPATRRALFAVSSTATGCAVLLMAATSAARAADQSAAAADSSAPIEEIVVTGIRKSIEDSIAAKKNNSSIVEVVSAEDIGKLPDNSIAESIARLPGLAAQRTAGRAQTLSIRGLGPDYTVTTFNGREQPSTSDSRSVEFDQYPSELVSQVKIFKTPDAGMSYQGIAGTADIETMKPLTYGRRARSVTYRYEKDGQKSNVPSLSDTGSRASATYIDQFMDHKVGVALGVAYNKTPYQAQARESWGYADGPGGTKVVGGTKDGVQSSYFQRTGWLGVLEFQPNDRLHSTLDGYHSDFKELQNIRRMEYPLQWGSGTLTNPGPVVDNRITSGTYINVPFVVIENYNNETHAKVDAYGLATDFKLTDSWTLNNDISYSKAHRNKLRLESTAGDGSGLAGSPIAPTTETNTFTTGPDGVTVPTITGNYSNYNTTFLADPGGWAGGSAVRSGRAGFWDDQAINDEIKAIKLAVSGKFQTRFLSGMSVGVNYAERTKEKDRQLNALYFPGDPTAGPYVLAVPDAYRRGVINTGFFGNPNGMINYDALSMFHSGFFNVIDARLDPHADGGTLDSDYTGSWRMNEKLTTPFIKFDIDSHLGQHELTGNFGVQAQSADQIAYLNVVSTTHLVSQISYGAKYTEVLPSMNLSLSVAEDMKLRFAAATVVSRPRMDDMAGGATYTATAENQLPLQYNGQLYYWQRNLGGNPRLKPWKANAFDLSLERYFSSKGYVSASVYYKQLKRFLYQDRQIIDFTGVLLPDQVNLSDPTAYTTANTNRLGVASALLNGTGGYIRGMELSGSWPGSMIANFLDGFGLIVSASWNASSVSPHGSSAPVPGLSPRVINSTVYYEKHGFSARISQRYRDGFDGEVPTFDGSIQNRDVKAETLLDAQVGYEFQEGAVKGLSLNLSGTNLTDTPFVQWNVGDPPSLNQKYEKYGAVYTLAINYKF
jgi:iron complex outermembrane receptor protein